MSTPGILALLVVAAAAAAAVPIARLLKPLHVPLVVVEILLGIVVGPRVLGLARLTVPVGLVASAGAAMLFFLAGLEIDPARLRHGSLRRASTGWLVSACLALAIALGAVRLGVSAAAVPLALAFATTALGMLVPILGDADLLSTRLGTEVLAAGVSGWVVPLLLLPFVIGTPSPHASLARMLSFLGVVAAVAAAADLWRRARRERALTEAAPADGPMVVRGAILFLLALVAAAVLLGQSALLGAFCAGVVLRLLDPYRDAKRAHSQIRTAGYGVFVPIFFVATGLQFDLSVFTAARTVLLVAVFGGAFFVVRGVPALLHLRCLGRRQTAALALFSSTKLPLLIVIATAALGAREMSRTTVDALIGAGMVSAVAFPAIAVWLAGAGPASRGIRATARRTSPPSSSVRSGAASSSPPTALTRAAPARRRHASPALRPARRLRLAAGAGERP